MRAVLSSLSFHSSALVSFDFCLHFLALALAFFLDLFAFPCVVSASFGMGISSHPGISGFMHSSHSGLAGYLWAPSPSHWHFPPMSLFPRIAPDIPPPSAFGFRLSAFGFWHAAFGAYFGSGGWRSLGWALAPPPPPIIAIGRYSYRRLFWVSRFRGGAPV